MARVTLVEALPWDPITGAVVAIRLAGGGQRHYRHKGHADWLAGVVSSPLLTAGLEFDGSFTGGAVPSSSAIGFMPARDDARARVARLMWVGAPIVVSIGDDAAPVPVWTVELDGKVAGYSAQRGAFTFTIANLAGRLNDPLVTATFTGKGGIEGSAQAAGRLKRRTWGRAWNVEGRLLDGPNNIYEFGDPSRPILAFDAVKDKGRVGPAELVAWAGSIGATLAALKAATAPRGGCAAAPSINCVKWWMQPSVLTADLRGEIGTGYVETVAGIAAAISAAAKGPAVLDLPAAIAARPEPAGLHVEDAGERGVAALDRVLLRASMGWEITPAGLLAIAPIDFDAPIADITAASIEREAAYAPATSVAVGWRRNHRRHSAAEVSAAVTAGDVTFADGTPVEDLKPAQPGADVTGYNTAKDTAAVGGRPSAAVLALLDGAAARAAKLEDETIPAINSAVLAASDRITKARDDAAKAVSDANLRIDGANTAIERTARDLVTEAARARDADEDLTARIDSIVAEGGYDDTAVRGLISTEQRIRADDDRALGRRVDTVSASVTDGDAAVRADVKVTTDALARSDVAFAEQARQIVASLDTVDRRIAAKATEVTTAYADADRALGRRIDSLVAEGGYDDRDVRAIIKRVDDTAVDRDGAISRRTDTLQAAYDGADTRITQVTTSAADANRAVGSLSDSVNTRFGGVNQTLAGYDRRITTISTDTQGYAGRTGTLEAQMARGLPSALNQFTSDVNDRVTAVNDTVNARIKSSEDVIADLPNRYAAASRTATIEAQLRREVGSNLNDAINFVNGRVDSSNTQLIARIEDRGTAIADARVGAVAERTTRLETSAGNLKSRLDITAGSVTTLEGKAATYLRIVGISGDNRVQVTIGADAGTGAGVDIVGNLRLSGALIISGTITRTQIGQGEIVLMQVIRSGTYYDGYYLTLVLDYTLFVPEAAPFIFIVNGAAQSYGDASYGQLYLYVDGNEWGSDTSYRLSGSAQNLGFCQPFQTLAAGNHSIQLRYSGGGTAIYYPSVGILGAFR